ncbi:MAG: site-specific integrase [Acidobacteriota bacterium]
MLDELFKRFVKEKTYLSNVSPKTVRYYQQSYNAFKKAVGAELPTRNLLNDFVVKLRENGMSANGANVYIGGMNSFLSWLWENNQTSEHLKIRKLKGENKVIQSFSDQQLRTLLSFRPSSFAEHRLYALLCLVIDTGLRIEECLTLTRSKIDFDNLFLTVNGKGNKARVVPLSQELRKVLYRWSRHHDSELFFSTRHGSKLSYRNSLRDFQNLAKKLGITGVRIGWHTLRHGFALNYVRQGGSLFHLQKALGHSSLQMTRRYVELSNEDLKEMHHKTSLLARIR